MAGVSNSANLSKKIEKKSLPPKLDRSVVTEESNGQITIGKLGLNAVQTPMRTLERMSSQHQAQERERY